MTGRRRLPSWLLLATVAACGAPSSTAPTAAEGTATTAPVATSDPAPVASSSPPPSEPEPKGACQRYLELYESCEPRLLPEIQAGNRRSFRAEKAWLDHIAKTPEVATLADACASMLQDFEKACP